MNYGSMNARRRQPGKVVVCKDGRVGRTYNSEPFVDGKVCVHLFPDSVRMALGATARQVDKAMTDAKVEVTRTANAGKEAEKRLCDPDSLRVIGYAD